MDDPAPTEKPKPSLLRVAVRTALVTTVIFIAAVIVALFVFHEPCNCGGSRVRSDQRSLATAIETYYIDHGAYPIAIPIADMMRTYVPNEKELNKHLLESNGTDVTTIFPGSENCHGITTPIAYITSIFPDPHSNVNGSPFAYATAANSWVLYSAGPDSDYDLENLIELLSRTETGYDIIYDLFPYTYDPTNGAISNGDVWRIKQ